MSDFERMFFDRLADALLQRSGGVPYRDDSGKSASAAYWAMVNGSGPDASPIASSTPYASPIPVAYMDAFASAVAARVLEKLQASGAPMASPIPGANATTLPVRKDLPESNGQ